MGKLIIYHGTSEGNAQKIMQQGFKVQGIKHNWKIKSKTGFVYFSLAYAPFYAMNAGARRLAIVKVEIDEDDLYPEDDFIMWLAGKPMYTAKELKAIDYEANKHLWKVSLEHMGNVSAKPDKIKVLGIKCFDGKDLIYKCDPVITPLNYKVMGDYYLELTEWIFEGKSILEFKNFMNMEVP